MELCLVDPSYAKYLASPKAGGDEAAKAAALKKQEKMLLELALSKDPASPFAVHLVLQHAI